MHTIIKFNYNRDFKNSTKANKNLFYRRIEPTNESVRKKKKNKETHSKISETW